MSMEQTLVADGDKDDYIEQGIDEAQIHANIGDLDTLRVNPGSRPSLEGTVSYTELMRFQQAPLLGYLSVRRPRTVLFEDN